MVLLRPRTCPLGDVKCGEKSYEGHIPKHHCEVGVGACV